MLRGSDSQERMGMYFVRQIGNIGARHWWSSMEEDEAWKIAKNKTINTNNKILVI